MFLVQKASLPKEPLEGRFIASVVLDERYFGKTDADNRIKCVLDYLERVRVITNDKNLWHLTVAWGKSDGATVSITEIP